MTSQPSGTVTFLFTDIEGSTPLWERKPDLMHRALARHDELVRRVIADGGGHVFAETGDGFAAAFRTASSAIEVAGEVQRTIASESWEDDAVVRVRIGVHSGESRERGSNYYGPTVNRAARIMGAAAGGQTLVSSVARDLAHEPLGSGLRLVGSARLTLRGVQEPVGVSVLEVEGIPSPPLVSEGITGNLAAVQGELVGRADTIADLEQFLASEPLITLVGVGGVGKTSIARHLGAVSDPAAGRVWFVPLAESAANADVDSAVAQALGLSPDRDAIDAVVDFFHREPGLLILDNCEHVIDGAAALAQTLIETAPALRIVATSREPLYVTGERVYPVRPLDTHGEASPAAALFVRRARLADPSFDPAGHRDAISALCTRLDGLPLALELAAARMRSLTPADVLDHLDERFSLLSGGRRTAVERHQTLRATVGWSYDLLDDGMRLVLDRISVFAGRFSLDDAVAVAGDDATGPLPVVEAVSGLVDRSLVETHPDEPRFVLLETVRAFAREQLGRSGDADDVGRRHAERCAVNAKAALEECVSRRGSDVRRTYLLRLPDQREAVRWAEDHSEWELLAAIVADLGSAGVTWNIRDAQGWVAHLLDEPPDPLPVSWPDMLATCANWAAHWHSDHRRAFVLANRARELDPDSPIVLETLSLLEGRFGRYEEVIRLTDAATGARQQRATRSFDVWMLSNRAEALAALGRVDEAQSIVEELGRRADADGAPAVRASHLLTGAAVHRALGDEREAQCLLGVIRIAEPANLSLEMVARGRLVELLLDEDVEAATAELCELIEVGLACDTLPGKRSLQMACTALAVSGDATAAAQVAALAGGLQARAQTDRSRLERTEAILREELGTRFDALSTADPDPRRGAVFALDALRALSRDEQPPVPASADQ